MGLDARGIASIVELLVYVPLLVISVILIVKHGFKRELGWFYLLLLSIIRIVSASTHIISEVSSNPSTTVLIVTAVTESSGLSPLLLATLGFFNTVSQYVFDDNFKLHRGLKLMHLLSIIALGLSIAGGVDVGDNETADGVDKINSGIKERRIGAVLFVVQYLLTVLVTVYLWSQQDIILKQRRRLLKAITVSIPFLGVRVLYTILSAFAPTGLPFPGVNAGVSSFSAFTSTTGKFAPYLIMSVIMEFIVIMIYVTAGLRIPLQDDYSEPSKTEEDTIGMYSYATPRGRIASGHAPYPKVYSSRGFRGDSS